MKEITISYEDLLEYFEHVDEVKPGALDIGYEAIKYRDTLALAYILHSVAVSELILAQSEEELHLKTQPKLIGLIEEIGKELEIRVKRYKDADLIINNLN